jgi:class 3 adenylate cyclase
VVGLGVPAGSRTWHPVPSGVRTICRRGGSAAVGDGDVSVTDIEGSTRRWETDPEAMRAAPGLHHDVLQSVIEAGGAGGAWLFKHTGDRVCAAFGTARAAIRFPVVLVRVLGAAGTISGDDVECPASADGAKAGGCPCRASPSGDVG